MMRTIFKEQFVVRGALIGLGLALAASTLQADPLAVDTLEEMKALQRDIKSVAGQLRPATVALLSPNGGTGSGVLVSEDGLILTAGHVVQGSKQVEVVFSDGETVKGTVLGANFTKDVAMVKIAAKLDGEWPYVELGDSREMQVGDYAVAMGHAGGYDPLRKAPLRFGRMVSRNVSGYFSTDCALIGGDSGGPIVDMEGKLVGINSSIGWDEKLNNHAGISGLLEDWERMLAGETWGSIHASPFANADSPVIGVELGSMTRRGLQLKGVVAKGPAAKAGLQAGDVIHAVGKESVDSIEKFLLELNRYRPGEVIKVRVWRDGLDSELAVTLAKRGEFYR